MKLLVLNSKNNLFFKMSFSSIYSQGEGKQRCDKKGTELVFVYKIDKTCTLLRYDGCHFGTLEQFEYSP